MKFKQTLLAVSVVGATLALSGNAAASGFALIEQSSGLGNAFAGGAAAAEDATTVFTNPAGMSRLKGKQLSAAASYIRPSAKFSNTGTTAASLQAAGGNGGDAGSGAVLPNLYLVSEIQPGMRLGLGINAPFGLQTEYDPNWIGRFQAIKSKLQTINLNPSLSYQVSDRLSLGIGVDYQHISGDLTSAVNYSAAAFAAGGTALLGAIGTGKEGVSSISGSDSAWGYNLGAMFDLSPDTRLGLAYRSKVNYTLKGSIGFSNVPTAMAASPTLANGSVSLPISMPDTLSLSAFHRSGDKLDLMADVTRTGWSVFKQLQVTRSTGAVVQNVQENWQDTWRFSVGATLHYNEQWLARVGVAYDQTPVSDAYRTARIPDNNRTWLAFGGQYKVAPSSAVDFAYAHLFVKDTPIANNQTATGAGNLVGNYSNSVDILSVQYAHSF